ncbi:hypothetical protein GJAV_G00210900 [Gymnothorax javanicus]|nr:hypothetical protein GJAV_G00210900 [Gymnothorax javanicus]
MVNRCNFLGLTRQCVPVYILLLCYKVSTEAGIKYIWEEEPGIFNIPAPSLTNGTEFSWEWMPHNSWKKKIQLATVTLPAKRFFWKATHNSIWQGNFPSISLRKDFQNAGVYTFKQTKPSVALLTETEVFAVRVSPFPQVQAGKDISSQCEISRLPKFVTLHWEKEGGPTANTTLLYNNTAYIVIHSANLQSDGKYFCRVRTNNGKLSFAAERKLTVTEDTYGLLSTLYRGSSNSSEVELTCQSSSHWYIAAKWSWKKKPEMALEELALSDTFNPIRIQRKSDRNRFSSSGFTGRHFPLRIAPVKFEDSGIYICHLVNYIYASLTLVNVQVSVEPPGAVSRDRPVVLTCEVSDLTETLTLAWLRMEGHRRVLVKQEILDTGRSVRNLSLTLSELSGDQLHWECAIFGQNMLRTLVPLHLTLQAGKNMPMIISLCVGAVCVSVLTTALLLHRRRRVLAPPVSEVRISKDHTHLELDAVYCDVTDIQEEGGKAAETEVLYSAFTLDCSGTDQKKTNYPEEDMEGQTGEVVYSALKLS